MTNVKLNLNYVRNNPRKFAENIQLVILSALIKKANDVYFNTDQPIISDEIYDILLDILRERDPSNKLINCIGAPVTGEKIQLPVHMSGMDKIKTVDGVKSWLSKFQYDEYIVSDKLDGTSCGYMFKNNQVLLFTRGRENEGRNITHLLPYLDIPKKLDIDEVIVRGELMINKQNFSKLEGKTDARSFVNGISIRKKVEAKDMEYIEFVGYEVIKPENLTAFQQFEFLKKIGFKTAYYQKVSFKEISYLPDDVEDTYLYKMLLNRKILSEYTVDGIIITQNKSYERVKSGNPKYSIAFKSNDQGVEVQVKKVEWNVSKHGILKPRIVFNEIILKGSRVEHATAHHAKYVKDNNIGPGTILKIVKSGEIIPYIVEVVKPSELPQMPNVEYKWNESRVNILICSSDNLQHKLKQIKSFIKTLGIENLSDGTIKKMVENNYDTIPKILDISLEQLLLLPGFKQKLSEKIYNNIHKVIDNPINLSILMTASLKFGSGFGIKRFQSIITKYPNILEIEVDESMITTIPGFQKKIATQFINGLSEFKEFMKSLPMIKIKLESEKIELIGDLFKDKNIVLTGFTDKEIEKFIIDNGGDICKNVSKKTSLLICKTEESTSQKFNDAKNLGIETISKELFINKYLKN